MNAAQGLEFRKPLKSSPFISELINEYRQTIPFVTDDVEMHPLMNKSIKFVQQYSNKLEVKDFL